MKIKTQKCTLCQNKDCETVKQVVLKSKFYEEINLCDNCICEINLYECELCESLCDKVNSKEVIIYQDNFNSIEGHYQVKSISEKKACECCL